MALPARTELLTQTAAGTPMGEVLRRYWMPIAGASELAQNPVKPVRLLGEDLVLYRDFSGTYGLLDRHCAHRRADLAYGFVEACGLRCNYHGWLYAESGKCLAQPYDDVAHPEVRLKDGVRIKAYPVQELAGLLWAYLGPAPAPLLPNWEFFTWPNGFRQIVISELPCNWFQAQENSIDPVHFEWMHANWSIRLQGRTGPYSPHHLRIDFEEFDHGIQYKRIRSDTDESDPLWTTGRVCLWPNMLYTGSHCEWRVPVDDENMLSISWFFARVPRESEPYEQTEIPTWHGPIHDQSGRWITSHIMNQDFLAWVGQGAIADRSREYLAASDRGVAMMRRRFLSDIEAVAEGRDPKAVIRDGERNRRGIVLPTAFRDLQLVGPPRREMRENPQYASVRGFVWAAGQPESVRQAYAAAMGFPAEPAG